MKLSIVVIFFNMRREANRTLYSLSTAYQQGVTAEDYEIIAIDNGSTLPLDPAIVAGFGPNIRYVFHETTSASPVRAINLGAEMARGDALAVIVDGARMASPGLIKWSLVAMRLNEFAFVCSLAWHLGPDIQPRTILQGYDQRREDAMLDEANWREDGYRLFTVATIAPASGVGLVGGFPTECSWLCMLRSRFRDLGGLNPAFESPGGGLCNQDFRNRALRQPDTTPTIVWGEGVFHQVHGGTATNAPPDRRPHKLFFEEYERIVGAALVSPQPSDIVYVGTMRDDAPPFVLTKRI